MRDRAAEQPRDRVAERVRDRAVASERQSSEAAERVRDRVAERVRGTEQLRESMREIERKRAVQLVLGLELGFRRITILPLKNVKINKKKKLFMFLPGIHLPAETVRFRRYDQYFFRYETRGYSVPVHWLVRYDIYRPVRYEIDFLDYDKRCSCKLV